MEKLQGFPFHQAEVPVFALRVVFRAAPWLEGSALPGQVKHPSTQVMAALCVCVTTLASSGRCLQHGRCYMQRWGLPEMSPTFPPGLQPAVVPL